MSAKSILALIFAVLFGIVAYKTVFSPVSIAIRSYPKKIYIDSSNPVDVKVVAVNRIGFGIPFMRLRGHFLIQEGATKIQVLKTKGDELIFRTKSATGKLVILYYTTVVPFPVEIVLNIETAAIASVDTPLLLFC